MQASRCLLLALALAAVLVAVAPHLAVRAQPAAAPAMPEPEEEDFGRPAGPPDPFNRGTPRGTMHGFITAARERDWERAAQHLDLRRLDAGQRAKAGDYAEMLKIVLDRTYWIDFADLSPTNAGKPDDGLPPYRDLLTVIETERGPFKVLLQRVPRRGDGTRIWKVAAETVEQIPELYDEFGFGALRRWLPPVFFEVEALGLRLWQWIGIPALALLAWLVSRISASLVIRAVRALLSRRREALDDRIVQLLRRPVQLALAVCVFMLGTVSLRLSLSAMDFLHSLAAALLIVAVTWMLLLLVDLAALVVRERLLQTSQPATVAFVTPGRKVVKVTLWILAAIALFGNLGFNVTALIAGFGVGGIAVAFAAQKTLEDLFGSVTLFADQPIQVGDFCRYGDEVGTVEEIGLRSTRVRSLDRTLITVPNAQFSALQLENFSARDQIRLFVVFGLRYETTPEQLRYVLAGLRELLEAHPKVSPDPARIRFVGFGACSLDLEVFAYLRTSDWDEFLQIREDIYLRMMDVVAEAGTGFAFPSQTTYLAKDGGLDAERTREAAARVAAWREEGVLPFPEFPVEHRRRIDDSLDWPPEGSPGGRRRTGEGMRPGQ